MSEPPFTRTVWVPLVDIRISERRSRSMRPATIEQYRLWLEQSGDPPAVRLAVQGDSVRRTRRPAPSRRSAGRGRRGDRGRGDRRNAAIVNASPMGDPCPPMGLACHLGDEALAGEHLACTEEERVRLPPSPPPRLRSVNGKHAPFVRPRCGFDSCRRLLDDDSKWIARPDGGADRRRIGRVLRHRTGSACRATESVARLGLPPPERTAIGINRLSCPNATGARPSPAGARRSACTGDVALDSTRSRCRG